MSEHPQRPPVHARPHTLDARAFGLTIIIGAVVVATILMLHAVLTWRTMFPASMPSASAAAPDQTTSGSR